MKTVQIIIAFLLLPNRALGEHFSFKKDTVAAAGSPYAIVKKNATGLQWIVRSVTGKDLIEIHSACIQVKKKPAYLVTFLSDKKQGILLQISKLKTDIACLIVDNHLIKDKESIDTTNEQTFINSNPLPANYVDTYNLIEY